MYWNRIFLLLSKHSFCWLDISESLKSCLNNFKWWRLLNDHDDVEGEEGATILVQLRLLLHRPPWASLMADAWFPTPFSTAESSTTPAILLHTLPTIKEIYKSCKSQIQNTQIHILNGRELHHPRYSIPPLLHALLTIKLSIYVNTAVEQTLLRGKGIVRAHCDELHWMKKKTSKLLVVTKCQFRSFAFDCYTNIVHYFHYFC